ncbi:hypothetical protein DEU56DRAFT_871544 [Suillus clintonianus]|uniref:uncharacterized protein n=1 Tax=Suillus clintonianus TaxID=1904413 RepID=UPI001B85EE39|nr:uncharacterized protein DEU56DRAFT_871544 [Suillus clintonianus]KAG2135980.1 hypothetical protein DEU56DRAFT_871544 [Suillus clintonianus]
MLKGKGKARHPEPSEQTPLLLHHSDVAPSQPRVTDDEDVDIESSSDARQRLWSKLTFVFLSSLAFCIVIFLLLALVAYSYAARLSDVSPEDVLENALVIQGPYQVNVLNFTADGGTWIRVRGRVGIDAGSIMGVDTDNDEGTFYDLWKSFGRWSVKRLDRVTVDVSTAQIFSQRHALLATIDSPPFELPLTVNPPYGDSWLSPLSLTLFVVPTRNASDMNQFVHDSWHSGAASVHASIPSVVVSGGSTNKGGWRRMLRLQRLNIQTQLSMKLPPIPGLPTPGEDVPLPSVSQLITLQSFGVESEAKDVTVHALATVINPVPSIMNLTAPSLPFIISLPGENHSSVPVASVHTDPFTLTHPNITLAISGSVIPLPPHPSASISAFISRYLSLEPNPVFVACPLFPSFAVEMEFPPPNSKPQILRNVTIHDMKIKPNSAGNGFLASGTVFGRIVLPKGMDLTLDVTRLFPDVLVFDGEVHDSPSLLLPQHKEEEELPNPLPERAFGHIQPEDWLEATSIQVDAEGEGSIFAVTADMVDVPLEVLPGRQKQFSNFISKVVFGSHGALAGLQGTTDVGVHILGLPFRDHEDTTTGMDLLGLPFQGSVRIAMKDLLVHRLT